MNALSYSSLSTLLLAVNRRSGFKQFKFKLFNH